MTLYGVDVANYQKGLKTSLLQQQGYSFLIAKATEGQGVKDGSYKRFLDDARRLKIPFAAYHFLRSDSSISAQANNLAAQITDRSVPVMIDCEVAGSSRPTLTMCKAFRSACEDRGIRVSMLYLPRFWWQQIGKPDLRGWTLVQALYGNNPTGYASATYPGDKSVRWAPMGNVTPTILQFGSNGKIDGYSGRVDVDAFRGTRAELLKSGLFKVWEVVAEEVPTEPQGETITVSDYKNLKDEGDQVLILNVWNDLVFNGVKQVIPPLGSNDWWSQVHLDLSEWNEELKTGGLKGAARNDLRYIKMRYARVNPSSADANKEGLDTHGTDTKAIPPDLPISSWQSTLSTDMKGLRGVPVRVQVYVGSMKMGTVVSPMRLFTVDDETSS